MSKIIEGMQMKSGVLINRNNRNKTKCRQQEFFFSAKTHQYFLFLTTKTYVVGTD